MYLIQPKYSDIIMSLGKKMPKSDCHHSDLGLNCSQNICNKSQITDLDQNSQEFCRI